jgi:5'-nucleotidase
MLGGVPINPSASYRVTVNSFLADGGDSFPVLVQGTARLGGAVDTDALEAYLTAFAPVSPGPQNRITLQPS